ncbi:hypothetical protein CCR94_22770 [Rhodoblastus sphagnicola]|uniref:Uncharacterized protein n=1 Tax=Rhodoblastus sphagnicola TaxID=333368 RepID=A0A2S6MVQ9_9HYPH|nr:hypothetical protein [Rhodoblastus sphagnicola]MBB4198326.1 nitroreductase [Rhodoblastus sphagnicola]PPQ26451.1 hypothetical protein CCR94_22770 [Rhodoblastus sphagnicola]
MAQAPQEQETTITVNRGLILLRYATGATSGPSPFAFVKPTAASAAFIEVISAPGVVTGYLSEPGDFVIVRAEQIGQLLVKIVAKTLGDPLEASFRIEPLGGDQPAPQVAQTMPPAARGAPILLAHVSRRGDVQTTLGAWIAGPEAPAPIEGLEVRGALPDGLSLELQPLLATNPPRWLDWAGPGHFVGTRCRALPLAGLRLRLSGAAAENAEIVVNALFLGSPVMNRRGREVEIVSAAGVDPLVGLRVELVATTVGDATIAGWAPVARPQESKLKVFRATANG